MLRKPPSPSSLSTSTSASKSSSFKNYPPSVLSYGSDADDEHDPMETVDEDSASPRLHSVTIPNPTTTVHGPCCPRRPNLREILANTAEPPWTLAAFMAYLSSNHCLETLEFTMDADRYKQHYMKMMANAGATGVPSPKDRDFVQELWERLVEAYIRPSGSREVNIPSNVRDPILRKRPDDLPPAPETLDPAVDKIHELMDESLLVPFLNSVYPHSGSPTTGSRPFNASQESITRPSQGHDDRQNRARDASARNSSPPYSAASSTGSRSYSPTSNLHRKSTPTSSSARQSKPHIGSSLFHATSNPAQSSSGRLTEAISESSTYAGPGMTDDSGDSPMHDSPTTPPTSPPLSDLNHPLGAKRDSGMWKRLGKLSGMNKTTKKRSDGGLREG